MIYDNKVFREFLLPQASMLAAFNLLTTVNYNGLGPWNQSYEDWITQIVDVVDGQSHPETIEDALTQLAINVQQDVSGHIYNGVDKLRFLLPVE